MTGATMGTEVEATPATARDALAALERFAGRSGFLEVVDVDSRSIVTAVGRVGSIPPMVAGAPLFEPEDGPYFAVWVAEDRPVVVSLHGVRGLAVDARSVAAEADSFRIRVVFEDAEVAADGA